MMRIAPARPAAALLFAALALAAVRGAVAQESASRTLFDLDAARAVADEFPSVMPQGSVMPATQASFDEPIPSFDAAAPREPVTDRQLMQAGLELTDRFDEYDESDDEVYDDEFDPAAADAAWAKEHSRNSLKGFILGCIGCLGVLLALKWLGGSLTLASSSGYDAAAESPTDSSTHDDEKVKASASVARPTVVDSETRDVAPRRRRRRSRRASSPPAAPQQPTWHAPITVASAMPVPVPVAMPQPLAPLGYMPYGSPPVYAPPHYMAAPPTYPMPAPPAAETAPPAPRAPAVPAPQPQPQPQQAPTSDSTPTSVRAASANLARSPGERSRHATSAHARANRGPTAQGRSTNTRTHGSPPTASSATVNSASANPESALVPPVSLAPSPEAAEREPQSEPSLPLPASSLFERILEDNRQVRVALDVADL